MNTLQAKAIQKDIREGLDTMRKAWAREMRGQCRVCVGLRDIRMSNAERDEYIDRSNELIVPRTLVPTLADIKKAASLVGTIDKYTGLRIDEVDYSARLDFIYGFDDREPSDIYMTVCLLGNGVDIDLPQ